MMSPPKRRTAVAPPTLTTRKSTRGKSTPQLKPPQKRRRRDAPASAVALRLLAQPDGAADSSTLFKWLVACVGEELRLGSQRSFVGTLLNISDASVPLAAALRGSAKGGAFKKLRSLTAWPQATIAPSDWQELAALLLGDDGDGDDCVGDKAAAASARAATTPMSCAGLTLQWPDSCNEGAALQPQAVVPIDAVILNAELSACTDTAARAALLDRVCAHCPRSVIVFDFFAADEGKFVARHQSTRAARRVASPSCRGCRQRVCRCSAGLAARVLATHREPSCALNGAALVRAMAHRGYCECSAEAAPSTRGFLLLCFKEEGGWGEC